MTLENPYGVMKAGLGDEEAIFSTLCRLHEENGMWPMNPEKVRNEIILSTRGGSIGSIIGLIKGKTGTIEGIVWLLLSDTWYTDWVSFNERLLYVVPEFRRSTHAKRLVQFAKWCSDQVTDKLPKGPGQQDEIPLLIGINTFKALEPKMRLYQRQFQQIGALFSYRLVPTTLGPYNQRHIEPPSKHN